MERTLVLVKPDAVKRGLSGEIIARLEKSGLKLVALKMLQANQVLASKHYAVHKERPFFNDLIQSITSAPIAAAIFEGDNAVKRARVVMGATNPANAEKGTIRGDLGLSIEANSVHGSDAIETALFESSLYFAECEVTEYNRE
ncbi:MAG: nucleoside-diphosphate kinase [Chloroflexi bacterium]|nr:nucleoside-diphosphate kinase [Chloroflexota bacterium]